MRARVLVVDDEESLRYTFKTFLTDEGYEVVTAKDFDEAAASIADGKVDLIFADIILGDRTGLDILREVKSRNMVCPVIMITGYPNIETASDAIRLGAFDYVPKPVQRETLLHVSNQALQYKSLIGEKEEYRLNLEAIFRSVKDAILTVNKEHIVIDVNESVKKICGFSRDDVVGKNIESLPLCCDGRCLEALRETIGKNRPVEVFRLECKNEDRPARVVTATSTPLVTHNGEISGAVMVIRDETRLAFLERDFKERKQFHNIIGKSEKMQRIYSLIEALSDVQTTVLIMGETGTGKEMVAEAVHYSGCRSQKPLVKVNCSALPENLLESELFGHVKGAFTGAIRDKIGRFQKADGGTIFLDEIGEVSPRIQLRLLRILQETEFERVGDSTPIKVDVRVIAATNQDLKEKIKRGDFRKDLYYRLNVMEIILPPLSERIEDIPLLINHFLRKFNDKFKKKIEAVSEDVQKVFMQYDWPGNIRELEHTLEHAFILCRRSFITFGELNHSLRDFFKRKYPPPGERGGDESKRIVQALKRAGWSKAKAARLLGISRQTIYRKMKEFNISEDRMEY